MFSAAFMHLGQYSVQYVCKPVRQIQNVLMRIRIPLFKLMRIPLFKLMQIQIQILLLG